MSHAVPTVPDEGEPPPVPGGVRDPTRDVRDDPNPGILNVGHIVTWE